MKRNILFFALSVIMAALTACGSSSKKERCTIEITCSLEGYRHGVLTLQDGALLDSLHLADGHLTLTRTDSTQMPYVARVVLYKDGAPQDEIEMPIVVEGGTVSVVLGELYSTWGTPLNREMQQFFVGMQKVSDELEGETDPAIVTTRFSAYYKKQILLHSDDVIGRFVLADYGANLTADDGMEVKTVMK